MRAGLVFVLMFLSSAVPGQVPDDSSPWSRSTEERDARFAIAEREKYHIRWIYISGNTYTRFRDFRKRMDPALNGGFLFSRQPLEKSIDRSAKMSSIFPITLNDVEVMLDDKSKSIDFTIKVRQKPRN